jgi:hypothetical protein
MNAIPMELLEAIKSLPGRALVANACYIFGTIAKIGQW